MAGWRNRIVDFPPDYASLAGKVQYLHQATAGELAGSCPKCGGSLHENGELPDRFRLFLTGKPRGWCRRCGFVWFPDMYNKEWKPDIALMRKWNDEREQIEKRKKEEAEHALELLDKEKKWLHYHENMGEIGRKSWENVGINTAWQNYWKLGYTAEKMFNLDGELLTSAAMVIPKFDIGWKPLNIDFRLLDAPASAGRYRPLAGLPPAVFISLPGKPLKECKEIFIVEGSKKAMILSIYTGKEVKQVIGVPSCTSWAGIEDRVKECEKVWIILDPGAEEWAHKLACSIGDNARVMEIPTKPDDAVTMYGVDVQSFQRFLLQAMRPRKGKEKSNAIRRF